VLFTTHRFNVCSRTDRILLFAKGRLVEQGTHAELMRIEGGEYRKLWEIQARGFV
jgi:ATP-binding cassette subfamily B protein